MAGSMIDAPSGDVIAITLDTNFKYASKALWVGSAGNVSLITASGQTVVFTGVAAGTILPIRAIQVTTTNTTVTSPGTNILALF